MHNKTFAFLAPCLVIAYFADAQLTDWRESQIIEQERKNTARSDEHDLDLFF